MNSLDGRLVPDDTWDAIVVGAGVTGTTLACLMGRSGRRTLLLDRAAFPRDKVCGCCLSASAVAIMTQLGLGGALTAASPRPLRRVEIDLPGSRVTLPYSGLAVSRRALDAALAAQARTEGATFLDQTTATLLPPADGLRNLQIQRHGTSQTLRARIIFACDGISGRLLDAQPQITWTISPHSRIGVHALIPPDVIDVPADAILMRVGNGGYVGLVRLEDGRIELAAALDPEKCRALGGPLPLAQQILRQCGDDTRLAEVPMHATPLLTRHRRVLGTDRVLAVGDACGYVEPFSGQGMNWGIASAAAVANLILGDTDPWQPDLAQQWRILHDKMLARPMRLCRMLTLALRYPRTLAAVLGSTRLLPALAGRLSHAISVPLAIPQEERAHG